MSQLSHSQRSRKAFWRRLEALGYATYADYLASDHWKDVRRRFWSSKLGQRCAGCKGKPTQIHHRTYARLGDERLNDLVAVCRPCHVYIHESENVMVKGGLRTNTKRALRTRRSSSGQ